MRKGILWIVLAEPVLDLAPPRFPHVRGHHVTLAYGLTDPGDWAGLEGRHIDVQLVAEAWDERVQALCVELPDGVPCANPIPHVTVSFAEGASARDANDMLGGPHQARTLAGTVRGRIVFDLRHGGG